MEWVDTVDFVLIPGGLDLAKICSLQHHVSLHAFFRRKGALLERSNRGNDANCWKPFYDSWTTAWLEMTGAKVIKLKGLRQSAAKPLNEKSHEEGSETMHVASHVDGDIVQTTTSKDGHGDME